MPYMPPQTSPYVPEGIDPETLVWAETVAPGGYTSLVVARGTVIRFDDPEGDACANVMAYNALEPWERYNQADTLKIPWQAYLGVGHPLLSGDGRVLATVTEDTSGHHDLFCGSTTDAWNIRKYGGSKPNGPFPSAQSLMVKAAAKHGLTIRDIPPSVSLFQGVHVEEDGSTTFTGNAGKGAHIDLLAELPLIVLIANVPHPLDPRVDYICSPLRIHAFKASPTTPSSERSSASPECERAYLNSITYANARGL
jgi:urea carboxylase-associated protein 2